MAAPRPEPSPPQDADPLLLRRYRVVETRATGGFGTVDVCWDTRLQRRVAIKRIPLGPATATETANDALAEARTSSLLAHPNIVAVYDFEHDASYAYLVMEYVDGITLAELLGRVEGGALTLDEAAHVIDSLAAALAFAHDNGVLHLDIKPANVLIDHSGAVKLGDFGMATLASAAGYGGARGGTVGYMSPEQLSGAVVDERADVFSLAVVSYQLLTGRSPFAAASAEASLALEEKGARPASQIVRALAGPVDAALAGALDPDPSYRTPSVDDFADEVLSGLGDEDEGRASIAQIMDQVEETEENAALWREASRGSLVERLPWLPGVLRRVASAAALGWAAWLLSAGLGLSPDTGRYVVAAACAASGALLPQLGGALVLVEFAWAVAVSGPATTAAPLVVVIGVVCAAWWVTFGRTDRMAALSAVSPVCVGFPVAAPSIAARELSPLSALVTGSFATLLGKVALAFLSSGCSTPALAAWAPAQMTRPGTWVEVVGFGLAACAGSALARRGSLPLAVLGQAITGGLTIFSLFVAARVENGGIWVAPAEVEVVVAVLFSLLVGIITAVLGPVQTQQEAE